MGKIGNRFIRNSVRISTAYRGYFIVPPLCTWLRFVFLSFFLLFVRNLAPFLIVYSGGNVNFWTFDCDYVDAEQTFPNFNDFIFWMAGVSLQSVWPFRACSDLVIFCRLFNVFFSGCLLIICFSGSFNFRPHRCLVSFLFLSIDFFMQIKDTRIGGYYKKESRNEF